MPHQTRHVAAKQSTLKQNSGNKDKGQQRRLSVRLPGKDKDVRIVIPYVDECRGQFYNTANVANRLVHGGWEYAHMCARDPCPGTCEPGVPGQFAWQPPGVGSVPCTWSHFSKEEQTWLKECGIEHPTWEIFMSLAKQPSTPSDDAEIMHDPFTPEECEEMPEPWTPES